MKGDRNRSASERLNAKTLDQMFVNMVEQGYECPPFVSNAILETAKSVFIPEQSNPTVMNVGQLKVLGIAASEPAGKPLAKCEMKTASSSRAYYAVFHIMQAALLTKNLTYKKHSGVISAFSKQFIKTGIFPKEFARYIKSLRSDRETSDYSLYWLLTKTKQNKLKNILKVF